MHVSLISMPWAIFYRPSIQLGALAAYLARQPDTIGVTCLHPYLSAAHTIGLDDYRIISHNPWAGEALYSALLFPGNRPGAQKLFCRELPELAHRFEQLTDQLANHFTHWLNRQDFSDCTLLGFSVCFSQLAASLYGAKIIKRLHPDLPIVFGGSSCTPAVGTGLLNVFSQVDYLVTGEGEQPLADLVHHICNKGPLPANVRQRPPSGTIHQGPQGCGQNREQRDLNRLPTPDYSSYFQEMAALNLSFIPELPIEFSRGCWWNKCSFCNLNLQWCGYRYKDHQKMVAEVAELVDRHQCLDFFFTDNALPPKEARSFFHRTAAAGVDLRFFAEIRIPRTEEECHIYRRGGLRIIQVGIEALSDRLLEQMCKGTTTIDNIHAMKMAASSGITLEGNLILEFPGSTEEDVRQTLAALAAVLPYRPLQAATFFLGDGSPVSNHPQEYGIKAVTTHPNNRLLFPKNILGKLDLPVKGYRGDRSIQRKRWRPVRQAMAAWTAFHASRKNPAQPPLAMRDGESFLLIRQERPNQPALHH
ncbi:MAG TPA: RiPP maturation radical SAM protein 1, partial [Desulfobulbus sp.]|nr:RiPP maturation radical SAM protein 1 [Desulfobulbus sp.]